MIHSLCKNHPSKAKLCRKYHENYETRTPHLAERKIWSCCFMQINIFPHLVEFRGVFLKLIKVYIVTELLVLIVLQVFTDRKK